MVLPNTVAALVTPTVHTLNSKAAALRIAMSIFHAQCREAMAVVGVTLSCRPVWESMALSAATAHLSQLMVRRVLSHLSNYSTCSQNRILRPLTWIKVSAWLHDRAYSEVSCCWSAA